MKLDPTLPASAPHQGRGAASNPPNRYAGQHTETMDDGWWQDDLPPLKTEWLAEEAKTILARNDSPDIPFDRSLNPYRGCEHGCIYCYARPSHAWLGLSPGLDFESRLSYKPDAARLLDAELRQPGYACAPVMLGANTDCYQPGERRLRLTRAVLEVLHAHQHPAVIITKSALVRRDLDLLAAMAARRQAAVWISLSSLDTTLTRQLEPRAAAPAARLQALRELAAAGVPVGVLCAPVIPALNDAAMENVLTAAREAGAVSAAYVVLRLPLEVRLLFREWLDIHYPHKARHVLDSVRNLHGGKEYDSSFGTRMTGRGPIADIIGRRFAAACKRLGLNTQEWALDCGAFAPPAAAGDQMALF